jgi:hypothetical protein
VLSDTYPSRSAIIYYIITIVSNRCGPITFPGVSKSTDPKFCHNSLLFDL